MRAAIVLIALVALLAAACGETGGAKFACGPSNCGGCCEPDGFCKVMTAPTCSSPGAPCGFTCAGPVKPAAQQPLDAGAAVDGGENDLRMFMSGARLRGDLTAIAGVSDPLLAADSLCQRMAEAERLSGTWMAFITADGGYPADRFTGAGPWRRMSGTLVFSDLAGLRANAFADLGFNEKSGSTGSRVAWTGFNGMPEGDCAGWSNGTDGGRGAAGNPGLRTQWNGGANLGCDSAQGLYCFEQRRELPDGGSSPPLPPIANKRAFVTSLSFSGDLGGIAGAHARCTNAAHAAGLGGDWRAWLGSSTSAPGSEFVFEGPWTRVGSPTRQTAVPSLETLRLGILQLEINVDERGDRWGAREPWTGAYAGKVAAHTCSDWTSAAGLGHVGDTQFRISGWQDDRAADCASLHPLYCFEQ